MDADRYKAVTHLGKKIQEQRDQEEARLAGLAEFVGSEAFQYEFMAIMNNLVAEAQADLDRSPNWFQENVTKTGYIVQQERARLQKKLVARIVAELLEKKAAMNRFRRENKLRQR